MALRVAFQLPQHGDRALIPTHLDQRSELLQWKQHWRHFSPLARTWRTTILRALFLPGHRSLRLVDRYADYWQQNVAHTLINRAHCIHNPHRFDGYGARCWGLTASDSLHGYVAHAPDQDLGVIAPTAAL